MSSIGTEQLVESLVDLVGQLRGFLRSEHDTWLARRAAPRHRLVVPVEVRPCTEHGPGSARRFHLWDISDTGMGVTAPVALEPGQKVCASLCVNNTRWEGTLRVVHCTERISGYRIGLALVEDENESTWHADDRGARAKGRRQADLEYLKDQIGHTMHAYRQARKTWGLLGVSVDKKIRELIAQLGPTPPEADDFGRRKQGRIFVEGDVHIVIPTHQGWKWVPAQVLEVGEDGAGLLILEDRVNDPIESMLAGECDVRPGTPVLLGLGSEPDTLWIPAEIVHWQAPAGGEIRAGVAFNTAASQEAFGA